MNVIIIYGTNCDENTAWIPWLKKELNKKGVDALIPHLPTPENQNYHAWSGVIKNVEINKDDIVVAWSTGAIFSIRYLYENNIKVKKLILISGFNNYTGHVPTVDEMNADFFMPKLEIARHVANNIICIKSDNDPYITQDALNNFASKLNAKIINIAGGGHFNQDAGYTQFPKLLSIILEQ